jgi:prepilin-type N-terminal cleavage/methylation domain-containing protein
VSGGKGYTLVEIILVIVILTIVLGIALPKVGDFLRGDELRTAALRLAGFIKEVRNRAIMEQRYLRVFFQPGTPLVWSERIETVREESQIPKREISRHVLVKGLWVKGKGMLEEGEAWFTFSPAGYCEGTVIYLEDRGGRVFYVMVDPYGADISFGEGEASIAETH